MNWPDGSVAIPDTAGDNVDAGSSSSADAAPTSLPAEVGPGDAAGNDTVRSGLAPPVEDKRCGPPPYQLLKLGARDLMEPDSGGDMTGVTVTLKHCPESTFALKRNGIMVHVTAGIETWIRFDAPAYISWLEGELRVPEGRTPPYLEATMVPLAFVQSVVPAWKADAALVYVEVRLGRTAGDEACRSPAGVSLSVKDQPQATVLYRANGASAGYQDATVTSDEGIAVIANLPANVPSVEIVASKPGCAYQTSLGDANSAELFPIVRAPLFPGAVSHQIVNPIR